MRVVICLLTLCIVALVVACGDDSSSQTPSPSTAESPTTVAVPTPGPSVRLPIPVMARHLSATQADAWLQELGFEGLGLDSENYACPPGSGCPAPPGPRPNDDGCIVLRRTNADPVEYKYEWRGEEGIFGYNVLDWAGGALPSPESVETACLEEAGLLYSIRTTAGEAITFLEQYGLNGIWTDRAPGGRGCGYGDTCVIPDTSPSTLGCLSLFTDSQPGVDEDGTVRSALIRVAWQGNDGGRAEIAGVGFLPDAHAPLVSAIDADCWDSAGGAEG